MENIVVYLFLLVSSPSGEPQFLQGFEPLKAPNLETCLERRDTFRGGSTVKAMSKDFEKVYVDCIEVDTSTATTEEVQQRLKVMFDNYIPINLDTKT